MQHTLRAPGPWLVAMCFGLYAAQWLSVIGFLPSIYREAGVAVRAGNQHPVATSGKVEGAAKVPDRASGAGAERGPRHVGDPGHAGVGGVDVNSGLPVTRGHRAPFGDGPATERRSVTKGSKRPSNAAGNKPVIVVPASWCSTDSTRPTPWNRAPPARA